ncbi:glycosyltransferase [Nocardioides anomalus]|uniref:Glycosyltransferase n=1 Tax=Nocardioides anomalus TaxID=2712223 RepID=A0A6G6WGP8_9ACTN|nr:glycosyltransferase [Nocardioides anomalus]QIG44386.1 glycosyltransferase [Nocardioides anomalus]
MAAVTVVYLGGFGRSGSTVVERVLGASRGWTNVGELIDLARYVGPSDELCGCGERFSACPLWSRVGELAFGGWDTAVFSRLVSLQRAAARQRNLPALLTVRRRSSALSELQSAYTAIYQAVAEVTGSGVVVDASKGPAFGQALAGAPELDLRMLNVVRDPRAVAWSWTRTVERPHADAGGSGGALEMWRIPAHRSAAQWSALQVEMAAIAAWGRRPSARLRYEDFVQHPARSTLAAARALGVELSATDLAPIDDRGRVVLEPSHGLSGNPSRFSSGVLELRRDDRWSHQMGRRDRAVVTAMTLPLLRAYGYPTHTSHRTPPVISTAPASSTEEHTVTTPAPTPRTTPALVSVVIPTRGRNALLKQTLASIIDQDYDGPIEIVVVHDREEIDPTLTALSRPERQVRSINNTRTGGLCGARNSGLLESRGAYYASCDDDDLWHPSKVRRQVERLESDPDLLAVGAGIRLLMGEQGDVDWPAREPVVSHERLLHNRVKELHSSTLMMPRAAFDVAGLYDEELPFSYGEDYDWLLRATSAGKVGAVEEVLADIRKDVPSWFRDKSLNTATALEYMLDKHPGFRRRRRGHARILGQIAYARAAGGQRARGLRIAGRALRRYPAAPHAWLALAVAGPGVQPQRMLGLARRLGRGLS